MPGPWGNPKMPIPVSKGDNSTEAGTEGCSHLQGREEITIPAKKFPATESSRGLAFGAGGWGETRWDSRMPKTAQSTESDGGPVQIYQARGQGLGQGE